MKHEDQFHCPIPPVDPKDPYPDTWPGVSKPTQATPWPEWPKDSIEYWKWMRGEIGTPAQERAKLKQATSSEDDEYNREAELKKARAKYPLAFRYEGMEEVLSSDDLPKKEWLVKGIIARGETSAWIAPPGGMKSALMTELAVAISNGESWHGRKVPSLHGVVYFALERADLVRRRIKAHAARMRQDAPDYDIESIVVVPGTVDLMNPETVDKVVQTIKSAIDTDFGFTPGLVVFDTFAKTIAAGGGDEDKAKDQGRVFANIQRIKEAFDYGPNKLGPPHIALIGHTGKDEGRGSRGSNAILGDADIVVQISGETVKTATVTKANDMPEGPLFSFKSDIHEFGTDKDGDPVTVNIVVEAEAQSQPARREKRLSETQEAMYRLLRDAGPAGLSTDDWNEKAREIGIGVKRRATLHNVRSQLCDKSLVREYAGIWRVNNA